MREGYKKTDVGVIPEDWEVKKLKDISELIDGDRSSNYPSPSEIVDDGVLFLSTSNIKDNKLDYTSCKFITKEKFDSLRKGKLQKNDIIITLRGTIGSIAKFDAIKYDTGFINAQMMIIRSQDIEPDYLSKYLTANNLRKQIEVISSGSAQPQLTKKDMSSINIVVPPLKEQEKIAEILSTVDTQIDDTEKIIEKTKELKKGLMQQLLTMGIGHKEFKKTEIGEIPVEWEAKKLGDMGTNYTGLSGKTKDDFENGNRKFITYSNVNLNAFVDIDILGDVKVLDNEKQNNVKYGDILFTGSSENPEEAGMTSVFLYNLKDVYLNSFCFGYRLNDLKVTDPRFYGYYFRGETFRKSIFPLAQGSTRYNISKTEVMNIKVAIPPLEEQEKIAQILSSLDNEIEEYENKKQRLEELKKGLMQQLLTGKIRTVV